mgnify:CR=1 FL=1
MITVSDLELRAGPRLLLEPTSFRVGAGDRIVASSNLYGGTLTQLDVTLRRFGVDTVFGLPGGTILPTYDPLFETEKIRHILVRHEQAATHAAEGYARSTGKPGVGGLLLVVLGLRWLLAHRPARRAGARSGRLSARPGPVEPGWDTRRRPASGRRRGAVVVRGRRSGAGPVQV